MRENAKRNKTVPAGITRTNSRTDGLTHSHDRKIDAFGDARGSAFPVAGIGASAGGSDAVVRLLEALAPQPGIAFVIIQHPDPASANLVPEILSRKTGLPIQLIHNGMPLAPNAVFVAMAGKRISLKGPVFSVGEADGAAPPMPIDHFLSSLARNYRERAIAIALSGLHNDGTLGLKAIREAGGVTFAQDELSSEHGEMPRSASRYADFVLPPEAIAAKLETFRDHYQSKRSFDREQLKDLFAAVQDKFEVDFSTYKQATIARRISRRMLFANTPTWEEYYSLLGSDPGEIERLYQDMLINVTCFFRDRTLFEALQREILPDILKRKGGTDAIRIWVAGCSTGEEAYSLGIILTELLGEACAKDRVHIFASDVNERVLKTARIGQYRHTISASVSRERLKRFFVRTEKGYQINKALRSMCTFVRHNILQDPPFSRLDLLSCRNLLIYIDSHLQKKVLAAFRYALNPDCFLVLGSSETITGLNNDFILADKKNNIYINAKTGETSPPEFTFRKSVFVQQLAEESLSVMKNECAGEFNMHREVDDLILSKYAPCGVVVNENLEVVQFRGQTGRFLEHASGKASFNLMKLLRKELIPHVHLEFNKVKKRDSAVSTGRIPVRRGKQLSEVIVEVMPVKSFQGKGTYYLILFTEGERPGGADNNALQKPAGNDSYPAQLENELSSTQEYLHFVIDEKEKATEELKNAYEEIQSSNEELRSTNEELETSKEELQSANEELTTVNEELKNRNLELGQLNNDLTNLLNSIDTPIVVLGKELNIRHFTPASERLLNLISTDAGRPFGNINHRISIENLEGIIRSVIDTPEIKEQEVQDSDGRWHLMRVRPYLTREGRVNGAVLLFFDINEIKQAQAALRDLAKYPEENPNPVMRILKDGTLHYANNASRLLVKALNCPVHGVVSGDVYAKVVHCLKSGHNQEVELTCGDVVYSLILSPIAHAGYVNVYGRDITDRIRAGEMLREKEAEAAAARATTSERKRLYSVLDTLPVYVALLDEDYRIPFANKFFRERFGESHGRRCHAFLFDRETPCENCETYKVMTTRAPHHWEWVGPDGRNYDIYDYPFIDSNGAVMILEMGIDITDRKKAESELIQAHHELERAKRLSDIGTLASTVAHEMRNPLAAISIASFNIKRKANNPELETHLNTIGKKVHESNQIINNLLFYSRIKLSHRETVNFGDILDECIDAAEARFPGRNVTVVRKYEVLRDSLHQADPLQMKEVINNILNNAYDVVPDTTGTIEIEAGIDDKQMRIRFKDNGTGIHTEVLSKVFDPFFTTKAKGTGLGLTVCHQIVKLHGGDIHIESGKGKGTAITVSLPNKRNIEG